MGNAKKKSREEVEIKRRTIDKIHTLDGLKGLFKVDDDTLKEITESIQQNGYDPANPIVLWAGKDVVIDGHTRLQAAKLAGRKQIPVVEHEFDDEETALEYAIRCQTNRRNLTDGDVLRLVEKVDKRGAKFAVPGSGDKKLSAQATAKLLGVGHQKVTWCRMIIDYGDQALMQDVYDGKSSVAAAYNSIRTKRVEDGDNLAEGEQYDPTEDGSIDVTGKEPVTKPKKRGVARKTAAELKVFNLTTERVEWAKWTWNPITGCEHGCDYCYAYEFAEIRFKGQKGFENGFAYTVHNERLDAPKNTVIPKQHQGDPAWQNVFVCSMGDLFGEWVDKKEIELVMKSVKKYPQWNYIFLTKNPKRLLEVEFTDSCWVGTTVDCQDRVDQAVEVFKKLKAPVKFFSCEPFLTELEFPTLKCIDWLIVGGLSPTKQYPNGEQPEWKWVEKLFNQARKEGTPIYFKPNLTARPKEYPPLSWKGMKE